MFSFLIFFFLILFISEESKHQVYIRYLKFRKINEYINFHISVFSIL
mgnify:CR=1 FL=1